MGCAIGPALTSQGSLVRSQSRPPLWPRVQRFGWNIGPRLTRALSSALEHYLDMVGVAISFEAHVAALRCKCRGQKLLMGKDLCRREVKSS